MIMRAPLGLCCLLAAFDVISAAPAVGSEDLVEALLGMQRRAGADQSSDGFTNFQAASTGFQEAGLGAVPTQTITSTSTRNTATPSVAQLATPNTPAPSPFGGPNGQSFNAPAWLSKLLTQDLNPQLSQDQTNGGAVWGTANAPLLPNFVSGPLQNGFPWGNRTANNTNYYDESQIPNTGVTRNYEFTVSYKTIAPDGVPVQGLVVNGQFPGPLIEANWGDWIQVRVTNNLGNEGTALHWHGFLQKETPYYDGVPSVTQCPIAPGSTFTYTFRASLYGTSWYHSHYSAQYAGGLLGPMVIHGPKNYPYDIDLGPVLLNDWYHTPYYPLVQEDEHTPPIFPRSNNNLINGKMNYPCPPNSTTFQCTPNAGLSKFEFQTGKKMRLRLINAGAEAIQKFSIDGHQFTVIANDFVPIQPYTTDLITLGVGQRTDVVVEGVGAPGSSYWMRSNISVPCSATDGVSPDAVALVYYENADPKVVPKSVSTVDPAKYAVCANDPLSLTKPFYPLEPGQPTVTQNLNVIFTTNATGHLVWEVNDSSFRGDYNDPTLLEAKLGQTIFPPERNVYNFGENASIRLVTYNYATFSSHPMHLHGHNFFVLATGTGIWDGVTQDEPNPQRRDVQLLAPAPSPGVPSYMVLQFNADNPGVWPYHCHIAWHVSSGLYINVLERPRDIREQNIPMVMAQTCRDWAAWSHTHVVDQIDSGL